MSKDWPYSQHSHFVKNHGGPEQFLRDHASANFQLGVEAEKKTEGWKGLLVSGAAIVIWELLKFGHNLVEKKRAKKRADLLGKSDAAEKQYLDFIQSSEGDEKQKGASESTPDELVNQE